MSDRILESKSDLPYARFYVTCHDTFMSGWGKADGKRNYCVFLCDTEEEATIVADNCRARSEMKSIRTSSGLAPSGKPPVSRRAVWSLMSRGSRFYEAGAFAADKAARDGGK